jgi:hypothetical protein
MNVRRCKMRYCAEFLTAQISYGIGHQPNLPSTKTHKSAIVVDYHPVDKQKK